MDPILVTALVDDEQLGPYRAEPEGVILIGRAAHRGLPLDGDWAPRILASLAPTPYGWLAINGESARMHVKNEWLDVTVPVAARVAIPVGTTELRWPALVDKLEVAVDVGALASGPVLRLQPADDDFEVLRRDFVGTAWALGERQGRDILEPQQRHAMAHLFRHLLDGTPRPRYLIKAGAQALGVTDDALKKQVARVRTRVNKDRFGKLTSLDELGEYLVERAQVVTAADLDLKSDARAALARARQARRRDARPPEDGAS